MITLCLVAAIAAAPLDGFERAILTAQATKIAEFNSTLSNEGRRAKVADSLTIEARFGFGKELPAADAAAMAEPACKPFDGATPPAPPPVPVPKAWIAATVRGYFIMIHGYRDSRGVLRYVPSEQSSHLAVVLAQPIVGPTTAFPVVTKAQP